MCDQSQCCLPHCSSHPPPHSLRPLSALEVSKKSTCRLHMGNVTGKKGKGGGDKDIVSRNVCRARCVARTFRPRSSLSISFPCSHTLWEPCLLYSYCLKVMSTICTFVRSRVNNLLQVLSVEAEPSRVYFVCRVCIL